MAPVLVVDNEATGCVRSANAAAVSLYGQQELIHVKTAIAFHVAFLNPLNSEWELKALIDFTLSNARRFYSSMGNPLDGKVLKCL